MNVCLLKQQLRCVISIYLQSFLPDKKHFLLNDKDIKCCFFFDFVVAILKALTHLTNADKRNECK